MIKDAAIPGDFLKSAFDTRCPLNSLVDEKSPAQLHAFREDNPDVRRWCQIVDFFFHDDKTLHSGALFQSRKIRGRKSRLSTYVEQDFDIKNISVEVLERPTKLSVLISWRDAARCNYGYQLWRQIRSRKAGICALTGVPIFYGDVVYRPFSRTPCPQNAAAMILANSLDESISNAKCQTRLG
jgi:hypothetical protein